MRFAGLSLSEDTLCGGLLRALLQSIIKSKGLSAKALLELERIAEGGEEPTKRESGSNLNVAATQSEFIACIRQGGTGMALIAKCAAALALASVPAPVCAAEISGIVLLPDGKPAEGALVALATPRSRLILRGGDLARNANAPTTVTGPDGRFSFPPLDGPFVLVTVSAAGYAEASSLEFAASSTLALKAWGQIDGGVRIGPRFGSDQVVTFRPIRPEVDGRARVLNYNYMTSTDDRGRFHFDRVIPGPGIVSRSIVTRYPGGLSARTPCWAESVEVMPGQEVQVTIGGKGRPVTGQLTIEGTPETPVDWTQNLPVEIVGSGRRFASTIEKSGAFRVEDVLAGNYNLNVAVHGPADGRIGGAGTLIGRMKKALTVPEMPGGRSNEPLDLGTIRVKLFDVLKVRDLAPDFDVERIGSAEKGRRIKLSDYRGKLVLLSFWAVWQYDDDMAVLKEVQDTHGSDPRFVLVSLACGPSAAVSQRYLKREWLTWTHGSCGDPDSGVAAKYKIREFPTAYIGGPDGRIRRIPLSFLIGPDGRIVAHDMNGTELEAVRKALENPKLFPAATKRSGSP